MATSSKASEVLPVWTLAKIANGSVCVTPGMFPATIIVAPNSLKARTNPSNVPAITP